MKAFLVSLSLIILASLWSCEESSTASEGIALENVTDTISYALGLDLAMGYMEREKIMISKEEMTTAIKNAFAGLANMTRVEAANYRRKLKPILAKRKEGEALTGLDMDRYSYAEGVLIGSDMKEMQITFNPDAFGEGIKNAQDSAHIRLKESFRKKYVQKLYSQMSNAMRFLAPQKKLKAETEGAAFMAATKEEKDVVSLPSGLMYKVIKAGKGASPKPTDKVEIHYEGRLVNGMIFDSSYGFGRPQTFTANQGIAGWVEALQQMKPGAKWQIYIPSHLAYGEKGSGNSIAPNSTLVFDIEYVGLAD